MDSRACDDYRATSCAPILWLMLLGACIAACGSFFAYHGPLSSASWQAWGNEQAWKIDVGRVVCVTLCAAFLVRFVFLHGYRGRPDHYRLAVLCREPRLIALFLVFLASVVVMNFYLYPPSFKQTLLADPHIPAAVKASIGSNEFRQVWLPYFTYFFYPFGMWCFIIYPAFAIFLLGFRRDYLVMQQARHQLRAFSLLSEFQRKRTHSGDEPALSLVIYEFKNAVAKHNQAVENIIARYLPALSIVFSGYIGVLLYSVVTKVPGSSVAVFETMTKTALESNKWVILFFACISIVLLALFVRAAAPVLTDCRYNTYAAKEWIDANGLSMEVRQSVTALTEEWGGSAANPVTYLAERVWKSPSFIVIWGISFLMFMYGVFIDDSDNFKALFPESIVVWLSNIFIDRR